MQIVIDIPEHIYESVKAMQVICGGGRFSGKTYLQILVNSVQNGTPLPKGHGKLIDADKYRYMWIDTFDSSYGDTCSKLFKDSVDYAPIIIEADKGERR